MAGLVVVAALVLVAVLVLHKSSDKVSAERRSATTLPTTSSTVIATTTTVSAITVPPVTTASTTLPPQTPAVDTSAVAGDPLAASITPTFQAYFGGINSKNFARAYAVLSAANRARLSYARFTSGSATSTDTAISVQSLQQNPDGSLVADVGFISHQAAANGPRPGETCTVWSLSYGLVPAPAGAAVIYFIDSASPVGAGSQPC